MSVIAMRMSNAVTKSQVGLAAVAVAAAATLTPVVAAQADIAAPAPLAPITQVLNNAPQDLTTWWQNDPWWWIGPGSNSSPGAPILVATFTPLSLIPGFLQEPWKRLTQNINFSVCFLGAGVKIGPYGTMTVSLSRGC